ncbi:hypothetical protein ElyMa_006784700 [Elysia marginata]|uniref:Uncharacterized protein n=1 Tax=Elysia marginata TaxID=1093978 RepID=A0AAV4J5Y6_9GAST|nr:hypothetical protein ElyMa_006784700 [Elysia marginata]
MGKKIRSFYDTLMKQTERIHVENLRADDCARPSPSGPIPGCKRLGLCPTQPSLAARPQARGLNTSRGRPH